MSEVTRTKKPGREEFHCETLRGIATIDFTMDYIDGLLRGNFFHKCRNIEMCGIMKRLQGGHLQYDWNRCPKKDVLNP